MNTKMTISGTKDLQSSPPRSGTVLINVAPNRHPCPWSWHPPHWQAQLVLLAR